MARYLRGTVAAPPPVAPPIYTPWRRITHLFHGWDGSTWDVTDGRNGIFLMPEGIEGMGMPDIVNYTFNSPVIHGMEWEGWRATGRDVHWVIGIFEDDTDRWIANKTAFWKIFRPGKTMRWEVILPNGDSYSLTVRFKSDDTSVYSRDPVNLGWAIYGITCMTEQPFWEGDPVSNYWESKTESDFFNGGYGPPFIVSSYADISTATITNPGDVETYARWEITGPFTTAVVGIDDFTVSLSGGNIGDVYVIDTDPLKLTATKNGVDIMASLGSFDFAPIPPGEDVVLSLGMAGTGKITASFTPLYLRSV